MTIPNSKNFCGGNFQDWLEIMLIDKCNGKCSWCVDKNGHHPERHLKWFELAQLISNSNKSNIILLGGEPTLYKELKQLIKSITTNSTKKVYLTTNGGRLSCSYVYNTLYKLTGINISIHHYDLRKNQKITGISLEKHILKEVITELHKNGTTVRLNCNLIYKSIDSKQEIFSYLDFAKKLGANSVRFAELKNNNNKFVDLSKIFVNKYGINNDPFTLGCNSNAKINGIDVNFRQMCGLQTDKRPKPIDPKQEAKIVLYYDGIFYNGWQEKSKELLMNSKKLKKLLKDVSTGKKTIKQAQIEIEQEEAEKKLDNGCGCCY